MDDQETNEENNEYGLTLKDIKLPKDPMATDQEYSDDKSSMASQRERNRKWLEDKMKVKYDIPQNDAKIHGDLMFVNQAVDSRVYDLDRPKSNSFSPTPNDWNQSDIDSDFHRYDPKRYPPRPKQPDPKESETFSENNTDGKSFQSKTTGSAIAAAMRKASLDKAQMAKGPTFGELVDIRQRQSRKRRGSVLPTTANKKKESSKLTVTFPQQNRLQVQQQRSGSRQSSRSRQSNRSLKSRKSKGKKGKKKPGINTEMSGVITQKEIDELNRQIKPQDEDSKPKSSRRTQFQERLMTMPGIVVQDVGTPKQFQGAADTSEKQTPHKNVFFQMETLDQDMDLNNNLVNLRKQNTVDDGGHHDFTKTPPYMLSPDTTTLLDRTQGSDTQTSRSPNNVSSWPNQQQPHHFQTFQVEGQPKQITAQLRRKAPHQESNFSFRAPPSKTQQQTSPTIGYQKRQQREETPEKIMREFNEKARTYKLGISQKDVDGKTATTKPLGKSWRELMFETKDEWEMTTADMYNPSPSVLYDAYLINLSHTIAARLSQLAGKNMRVNLRQGKPFKKIQINVTTVHQTKFRLTKFGNGFGYGTTDKLSPEDAFLQTVFEKADPNVRETKRLVRQRETLKQIVPPIVKKAPKPITDSLKALHMACRRGVPIDQNGMPFLVENDLTNRDKYLAMLQQNNASRTLINQQSTQSIRSYSLNNKESLTMRMMLGDQEASSMAKLTQISEQSNIKSSNISTVTKQQKSPQQKRFKSVQPPRRSNFQNIDGNQAVAKNQRLIKKVDHLITKFDESFRQNELQQKAIRDAQQKLQAAKNQILEKINKEDDETSPNIVNTEQGQQATDHAAVAEEPDIDYESDGSHKHDSCMQQSDDEELNYAQSEQIAMNVFDNTQRRLSVFADASKAKSNTKAEAAKNDAKQKSEQKEQMKRTFQTNEEREDYYKHMNTLQEKFSNLTSQADQARQNQWDTRKELRKVSQPSHSKQLNSLAASKKSFKRNRNFDNLILNERSGDLMSSNMSSHKMLTPQEIFQHFEQQKIIKETKKARQPPKLLSHAEKQLESLKLHKNSGTNTRLSLLQMASSKAQMLSSPVSKQGENSVTSSPTHTNNPTVNTIQDAKIKYRPVPMQTIPKKKKQKELSTERSNFVFDINEAANREAQQSMMNRSIMDQLQTQEMAGTPKSRLPRKLHERERKQDSNNRDIEAFIKSSQKQKSPVKQISITTYPKDKTKRDDAAYQTMTVFKKDDPESSLMLNEKLPMVSDIKKLPDSDRKTMHQTMTELAKPLSPRDDAAASHSPFGNRDSGLSGTITTNVNQNGPNPMQTTLFGSEDFNHLRERANQSGAFDMNSQNQKMQIVDEADETETINRPSFFDEMQMKFGKDPSRQKLFQTQRHSPTKDEQIKFSQIGTVKNDGSSKRKLEISPSSAKKLSTLKQKQIDQVKIIPRKPPVPSYSPTNPKLKTQNMSGLYTTRGSNKNSSKIVNLKPIHHTDHKKFQPHPNNYKKFRTSLPPTMNRGSPKQTEANQNNIGEENQAPKFKNSSASRSISPYQMMLEEMKNNERPTIQNMDDSIEFTGGEVTLKEGKIDKNKDASGARGTQGKFALKKELSSTFMAFEERLEKMMQQTNSTVFADHKALMAQSIMSELEKRGTGGIPSKFAFASENKQQNTNDQVQHKRPYFKNEKPLPNNFSSILERRFQETEQNFKKEAQRLIEDVKKIEQIQGQMGMSRQQIGNQMHTKTMMTTSSMLSSTLYGDRQSGFKARHGSLQAPQNSRAGNIKEQLRALKLSEANAVKGNQQGLNQTLREERRRKSAFVTATDEEHRRQSSRMDGAETNEEAKSLHSPFAANSSSRQSYALPVSRGFLGQQQNNQSSMKNGRMNMMNQTMQYSNGGTGTGSVMSPPIQRFGNQVFDQQSTTEKTSQISLTFKKFQQDSQKDYTREILPNVTPAIKR